MMWFPRNVHMRRLLRALRVRVFRRQPDSNTKIRRALLAAAKRRLDGREACVGEIGVWKGDFSALILSEIAPQKLHLIDPWEFNPRFPHTRYGGQIAKSQHEMDGIFRAVQDRFANQPNVVIHRKMSKVALPSFEDNYFDWIYVDGNHDYEFVLGDLRMCLRKVKHGGVIAGDDYGRAGPDKDYPVQRAIRVFCEENNLQDNLEVIGSQYSIEVIKS